MSKIQDALRRVNHDLSLDRGRVNLGIPIDEEMHNRLLARQKELQAQLAAERAQEAEALKPKPAPAQRQPSPILEPMGMDETVAECEHRVSFGKPHRKVSSWI